MQADLLDENALLLCEKGKYKEAIQAFEKAYSEKIKLLGIDHEETIRTLANIGNLYIHLKKFNEAFEMHDEAYREFNKYKGENHPETLNSLGRVATVLGLQGKYEESLETHKKVLHLKESDPSLGPSHVDTLNTVNNMGVVLRDLGNQEEALKHYNRALEGYQLAFPSDKQKPEHDYILGVLTNIGVILLRQKKLDEAMKYYNRIILSKESFFGPNHQLTLNIKNQWGALLSQNDYFENALRLYLEVLEGKEKLKLEPLNVAFTTEKIARCYFELNDLKKALVYYLGTLDTYEKNLNESNIAIYKCLTKISLICEKLQNQSDAEQYAHRVVNFYENFIQSSDTAVKLSATLSAELSNAYSLAKTRIITKSDNP